MDNETISTLITCYYSSYRDHNRIYEHIIKALEGESARSERIFNRFLDRTRNNTRTAARSSRYSRLGTNYSSNIPPILRPLPPTPPSTIPPPPTRPPTRPSTTSRRSHSQPHRYTRATQTVAMTPINTVVPLFQQTFPANFFTPVPIIPTQRQIENATEVFLYQDISTNQLICPITMEEFVPTDSIMRIRHCRHVFSKDGLLSWFETSPECPACRHDIRGNDNLSQNVNLSNIFNNLSNTLSDPSNNLLSNLFSIDPSSNQISLSFNY
jgi:hypothetical protein